MRQFELREEKLQGRSPRLVALPDMLVFGGFQIYALARHTKYNNYVYDQTYSHGCPRKQFDPQGHFYCSSAFNERDNRNCRGNWRDEEKPLGKNLSAGLVRPEANLTVNRK